MDRLPLRHGGTAHRHRLAEVLRRVHILEGRMTVFVRIEEVIRCILESDEPKPELIARFALTDNPGRRHIGNPAAPVGAPGRHPHRKGTRDLRAEHGQLTTCSNRARK